MIRKLVIGPTLVLVLATCSSAQPQGAGRFGANVPPILRQMVAASKTLRYSGTRTVEFKQGADREGHTEFVRRDGPRTRIEFPKGSPLSGQIIVENERERMQFFPQLNEIHVMPPRREEATMRLGQLLRDLGPGASIKVKPSEEIAGLATSMVSIADAAGNVIQRLWINPRTGLLLKRELLDAVGTLVGSFEFTQVNLSPDFKPEDFRITRQGARIMRPRDLLRKFAGQAGVTAYSLPDGDEVQLEEVRLIRIEDSPVLVQTFQAPGGTVSLFITSSNVDAQRFSRMARMERFNVCVWDIDGRRLALIGSQPEAQLRRFSRQVSER